MRYLWILIPFLISIFISFLFLKIIGKRRKNRHRFCIFLLEFELQKKIYKNSLAAADFGNSSILYSHYVSVIFANKYYRNCIKYYIYYSNCLLL